MPQFKSYAHNAKALARIRWGLIAFLPFIATLRAGQAVLGAAAALPATLPAANPPPPPFIIGVWQQPAVNFAVWKARGINTNVVIPTNGGVPYSQADQQAWSNASESAGMFQIRAPIGDPAADAAPHLLAFAQPDEPEVSKVPLTTYQANYAAWKKARPSLPVFLNLDGSYVLGIQTGWTAATYAPFLLCGDEIASDIYPLAGWGQPTWLDHPALSAVQLAGWCHKPQTAFIETSLQYIVPASQQATPSQVLYQVWHAVLNGVTRVVYFPQQLKQGSFSFDGTPPQTVPAITELNKGLAAIGPYVGAGLSYSDLGWGWEYGVGPVGAKGHVEVLLNSDQQWTRSYGGNPVALCGVYVILFAPSGTSVLYQTPVPVNGDTSGLTSQVNQLSATLATVQQQMAGISKASAPATQP